MRTTTALSDEEINMLLADVLDIYGYDFSGYSRASLNRRINRLYRLDRHLSFAEFRHRLRIEQTYFTRFVEEITVNVTEFFRDTSFYRTLREVVFPALSTYPYIRIWHAGCATGQEVYSLAILLHEAGLLSRTMLYATDINPEALTTAKKGIYQLSQIRDATGAYNAAGGKGSFSDYYSANYDRAIMNSELGHRILCSTHNLASDSSFNEFQLILCRNVLIYFDRNLQNRVLKLFDASLDSLSFLALGSKETLQFSPLQENYTIVAKEQKIWRKTR